MPHSFTIKQLGEFLSKVQYPLEKSLSQLVWTTETSRLNTFLCANWHEIHRGNINILSIANKLSRFSENRAGAHDSPAASAASWIRHRRREVDRLFIGATKKGSYYYSISTKKDAEPDWISAFVWKLLFRGINTCATPHRSAEVKIAQTEISAKEWNDSGSGWMNTLRCLMATTCSSWLCCWLHFRQARCKSYF